MVPVPYEGGSSTPTGGELSGFVCPSCSAQLTAETGRMICTACGTVLRHGAD
jgi:uncharacterized Zn finger protein (UPF0148 family)